MRLVRDALYRELISRRQSYLLRGVMFLHLRKDLEDDAEGGQYGSPPLTPYGIPVEVQKRPADIRTDLDSFNQVEAFALMASGYRMTQYDFRHGGMEGFAEPTGETPRWKFLEIDEVLRKQSSSDPQYQLVLRLLSVGAYRFGKVFRLSSRGIVFRLINFAVPVSAVSFLFWLLWRRWEDPIFIIHGSGLFTALILFIALTVVIAFLWRHNRLEQASISLLFSPWAQCSCIITSSCLTGSI